VILEWPRIISSQGLLPAPDDDVRPTLKSPSRDSPLRHTLERRCAPCEVGIPVAVAASGGKGKEKKKERKIVAGPMPARRGRLKGLHSVHGSLQGAGKHEVGKAPTVGPARMKLSSICKALSRIYWSNGFPNKHIQKRLRGVITGGPGIRTESALEIRRRPKFDLGQGT